MTDNIVTETETKTTGTKGEIEMDISYIITNSGNVNIFLDGESYIVDNTHANYDKIINALREETYEELPALMDIAKAITVASEGAVTVVDGAVLYNGSEVINPLVDRILNMMNEGMPFKPMLRFLGNLMENVSRTAVEELFLFMEANTLPITPDGHFLAYKRVDKEHKDCYTHTIDNSLGAEIPRMNRNEVDDVRDNLCSTGYHFCSLHYLQSSGYGGNGPIMLVKVNPADVVSIPSDYNNQKGRCCWYQVVAEHQGTQDEEAFDKTVHESDGGEYRPDPEDEYCNGCDEHIDDCMCDERCGDCGEYYDNCTCEEDIEPTVDAPVESVEPAESVESTLGVKPSGHRFHNVRDGNGRFVSKK